MTRHTILIVDDQPSWRDLLRMLFMSEYQVYTASNIDAVREKLASQEFDLVITNLQLNAVRYIRDQLGLTVIDLVQERAPGTPCILLTASEEEKRSELEAYCLKRHNKKVPVLLKWNNDLFSELRTTVRSNLEGELGSLSDSAQLSGCAA